MANAYQYAKDNQDRFLDEYIHLLKIPTVSTQSQHADDVAEAANWLKEMMLDIGMDKAEVILMPEGRCPLVLGEWYGAGNDAKTLIIYCHYDVQPAILEDGWDTEPFEPTIKDGQLFCRGAVDSKLHVIANLKAIESWLVQDEKPNVNLKIVLEGEEESGSENIIAFLKAHPERLSADYALLCDGTILVPDLPSLTFGLRGITALEVHVKAAATDLHSGHWGGTIHNPLQALSEILTKLHDESGKIMVPGFYDDVIELTDKERELLAKIEPNMTDAWNDVAKAPQQYGEPGYNLSERIGARPTLEINGLLGGYTDEGMKTVLPEKAMAKISCRLAYNQDPDKIAQQIRDYIHEIAPPTVSVEVKLLQDGARAVRWDLESPAMQAGHAAYIHAWGNEPVYELVGATIPVLSEFTKVVDHVVKMGYGLKSGRAHGPNENIYLENFFNGIQASIKFIDQLGE